MTDHLFGRIITAAEVEQAVVMVVRDWLPTYLAELERQMFDTDTTMYPAPRSYQIMPETEHWAENQLPAVLVVSPGTADEPKMAGDGTYIVKWTIAVGIVVSANTDKQTEDNVKVYGAAVRAAMLQKGGSRGLIQRVEWLDESYDDLPADDTRTLGMVQATFAVEVPDVVRSVGGPAVPDLHPDELPTVEDVFVEIEEKV